MKHKINIKGVLIPNDYKWYYDYFGEDSTCPNDVKSVMDILQEGDEIEVYINSPGGTIEAGSEIYTMIRSCKNSVKIYITGQACSAASIVAMAAYCEMSPTALLMVHCVSTMAAGNHNRMEQTAEVLRTADKALCSAYVEKTGMTEAEALEMMEKETWLTAQQAKEMGLIDRVMFEEDKESTVLIAGPLFMLPTKESMEKVKIMLKETEQHSAQENVSLIHSKLQFLKLKGEKR